MTCCSFCGKDDEINDILLVSGNNAFICNECVKLCYEMVVLKNISSNDSEENVDQSKTPTYNEVNQSSLEFHLSTLIDFVNSDTWFDDGESTGFFTFPDDVRVMSEEESIDNVDKFLEYFGQMSLYRSDRFNGISFLSDQIKSVLENEDNMWRFTFTLDFGNVSDVSGNLISDINDNDREVKVSYLQFGAGEICGYQVIVPDLINRAALANWIENVKENQITVSKI